MWTIVWTDHHGFDHYRRESKEGAKDLVTTLYHRLEVDESTILIFPPQTELEINELMEGASSWRPESLSFKETELMKTSS